MTRGELAKVCDVNIETLRYYEKQKLIAPPPRSSGGYRIYSEADAIRVRFIKSARNLGFTLKEVMGLMKLRVDKKGNCNSVVLKAKKRRDEVDEKIKDLKSMRKILSQLIGQCEKSLPTNDCPILSSFESNIK